jgi:hypothetical protein
MDKNTACQLLGKDLFYAISRLCLRVLEEPGSQQYVGPDQALADAAFVKGWLWEASTDDVAMSEVPFAPR